MATPPLANEKVIIQQLREGSEHAFNSLYHYYSTPVAYHVVRIIKSAEIAEEIVQEIWLKVWACRKTIDPDGYFQGYIYRIAQNLVIDTIRRSKKEKAILAGIIAASTELYSHVEERMFLKENTAILHHAVDQLPLQRKAVFTRCKLEGKSYKETADELGISVKTVDDHIQKATKFLREYLSSQQGLELALLLFALFYKN